MSTMRSESGTPTKKSTKSNTDLIGYIQETQFDFHMRLHDRD